MRFYIFIFLILALLSVDLFLRNESHDKESINPIHTTRGAINSIVIPDTTYEHEPVVHIDPILGY